MLISVIIPTYNPKDYVFECLNSLATQTLSKDLWEALIILNGSNEPWYTMLSEYIQKHDLTNVRLFQTDEAGVSNARNIGLKNAKGEYITFIDDDDYISDVYLEEFANKAQKDTVVLAHPKAFEEIGVFKENYSIEQTYLSIKDKGKVSFLKAQKVFQGPCMKLFHKDVISNHLFDKTFKNGEDALFMFLISKGFKYIETTSDDAIYYRRIRWDGAAYGKKSRRYVVHNSMRLIGQYISIFMSHPTSYRFSFFITRILGAIHACLI